MHMTEIIYYHEIEIIIKTQDTSQQVRCSGDFELHSRWPLVESLPVMNSIKSLGRTRGRKLIPQYLVIETSDLYPDETNFSKMYV